MTAKKKRKNQEVFTMADLIPYIVGLYVLLMLAVFPLFVTNKYYNILHDRYNFFWICTLAAAGLCLLMALPGMLGKRSDKNRKDAGAAAVGFKDRILRNFCITDAFLLLFLIITAISTLCSEWVYEAFWGNMGRFQGLFIWIWYVIEYIIVSRLFRYNQQYLDLFIIIGIIVSVWGAMDTLGLDPAGWISELAYDSDKRIFSSTYGNINTLTSAIAIWLGISAVLFTGETRSRIRFFYYWASTVIFFFGLIMGRSDNAVISIAVLLCFLPFYAWKDKRGLLRYIFVVWSFAFAMFISALLLNSHISDGRFVPGVWGMLSGFALNHFKAVTVLFIAVTVFTLLIAAVYYFWLRKNASNPERAAELLSEKFRFPFRIVWGGLGVLAFAAIIYILFDANTGGHPDRYARFSSYLIFDDDWGTNRGFNWRLLIGHFRDFSPVKKLIGSGPETYGIVTEIYDYDLMVNTTREIYDSPHNEFLQHMFNTGILGVIAYYGFIVSSCVRTFLYKGENRNAAAACAFAVIMYSVQALVNISVPIVMPTVILLIALSVNLSKGTDRF